MVLPVVNRWKLCGVSCHSGIFHLHPLLDGFVGTDLALVSPATRRVADFHLYRPNCVFAGRMSQASGTSPLQVTGAGSKRV